jgi:polysaccharide biosynthesis transport protein
MRTGLKPVTDEPRDDERPGLVDDPRVEASDWFDPLYRSRWFILAFGLGAGILALVASFYMAPLYEAVSTLRLVESKLVEERRITNTLPSLGGVRALVETGSIAAEALNRFQLNAVEGMTRTDFLNSITTDQVPASSLVRIRVRLHDAERAATVANWLARKAIESNGNLNQTESREARDFIGKQLEEARTKLRDTEKRLLDFKQKVQLDLVKKDVAASLKVREELLQLRIDTEAARASVARAEDDLSKTERIITTQRTIDRDPALMEAARSANATNGNASASALLGIQIAESRQNPVYEVMQQELAKSRAKLRLLEEGLVQSVKTYGVAAATDPKLQRMYADEIALKSLEAEHDLLLKIYSDLASRYEIARIQVASQSSELQLVDEALMPERPIAPRKGMNTAVAMGFGFVFASIWVYLRDAARRRR